MAMNGSQFHLGCLFIYVFKLKEKKIIVKFVEHFSLVMVELSEINSAKEKKYLYFWNEHKKKWFEVIQ